MNVKVRFLLFKSLLKFVTAVILPTPTMRILIFNVEQNFAILTVPILALKRMR